MGTKAKPNSGQIATKRSPAPSIQGADKVPNNGASTSSVPVIKQSIPTPRGPR